MMEFRWLQSGVEFTGDPHMLVVGGKNHTQPVYKLQYRNSPDDEWVDVPYVKEQSNDSI